MPAMRRGICFACGKRGFVVTIHPRDMSPILCHRCFTRMADMFMDIYFSLASRQLCTPRNRAAMIAISRGRHSYFGRVAPSFFFCINELGHRIGPTKGFE